MLRQRHSVFRKQRARNVALLCGAALMLAACGGGNGRTAPDQTGPAQLSGTLAYVASGCRETPDGVVTRETLRIQQGEHMPADVMTFEAVSPGAVGSCALYAGNRIYDSTQQGAFPRLAVSPDGGRVAFELADDFSLVLAGLLPPEMEGFYAVGADGSGLRRLSSPSREPAYFSIGDFYFTADDFKFTPDGRAVVFPDKGPGPAGEEAVQIVRLDLDTGVRLQLTHLPLAMPAPELPPGLPAVSLLTFLDDTRLGFLSQANPDMLNPRGEITAFTVRTDGSGRAEQLPDVISGPSGGSIDPTFRITGDQPRAGFVHFPDKKALGPPSQKDSSPLGPREIFLRDGDNLLQLTNFSRADTFARGPLSGDGQRVFFTASADPLDTNPTNNCQIFSIDRTGTDLRQITSFREGVASFNGCTISLPKPKGCYVDFTAQDPVTQSLVFLSTCDPFGTNANGEQVFAIRPDGTGLRQLTNFAGLTLQTSGASGEGPGALAFGSSPR